MSFRIRWMKFLMLVLCSGILTSIECPHLVFNSFKSGVTNWVTGSFTTVNVGQLGEALLNSLFPSVGQNSAGT